MKLQLPTAMMWTLLMYQCSASSNKVMHYLDGRLGDLLKGDACVDTQQVGRCSMSSSCIKVVCPANLTSQPVTLTITINRCNDPVTITTHIKSIDSALDWTYNFTTNQRVAIPGFHYRQKSTIIGAFLNATFTVYQSSVISLQVSLQYGSNKTSFRSSEIINHRIPLTKNGCPFLIWWGIKTAVLRMSIVIAMTLVIVFIVLGCCYCCLCQLYKEYKRDQRIHGTLYPDDESLPIRAQYRHPYSIPHGYGINL